MNETTTTTTSVACCADPMVRGGRCDTCGTWAEEFAPAGPLILTARMVEPGDIVRLEVGAFGTVSKFERLDHDDLVLITIGTRGHVVHALAPVAVVRPR